MNTFTLINISYIKTDVIKIQIQIRIELLHKLYPLTFHTVPFIRREFHYIHRVEL